MMGLCDIFRRRRGQAGFKAPKSALAKEILANPVSTRQLRMARTGDRTTPIVMIDSQGRQRRFIITSALDKNSHS